MRPVHALNLEKSKNNGFTRLRNDFLTTLKQALATSGF